MRVMMKIIPLVILVCFPLFVAGNLKNPLKDPYVCGRPLCDDSNWKFKYQLETKYQYKYNMFLKSEFAGSGDNVSEIYANGYVTIIFPKPCEGILRLSSIELRRRAPSDQLNIIALLINDADLHPRSEEFKNDLEKHEMRFSYQDGLISEVCPNEEESTWTLNFKKGILSTFQNTMTRFDVDHNTTETDISGACDIGYQLVGTEGTKLSIQKVKDIESCKFRYKTESVLQTSPYDFRKNYAAWPILNSKSLCNISIDHHIYDEVVCYEKHLLAPFSNNETGAVMETKISLKLEDEDSKESFGDELESITKRSTLVFDHLSSTRTSHQEIIASRDYLKQMCKMGFPDIQREFPDVFVKFLSAARLLPYTALHQLLARASSICGSGKNHVLESLPYIGSTASIVLMKDHIVQGRVNRLVAESWMVSLAFITRPNHEIVGAMSELVRYGLDKNLPDYILSATAVAATYCKQQDDCGSQTNIATIVSSLESELEKIQEFDTRNSKDKTVLLLKALGNIGVFNKPKFDQYIKRTFIENHQLPTEIRIQAVQVFRRSDCAKHNDYFMDLYKNYTMQSEVRIYSYLQTMRCPDYISIKMIKHVLRNEKINQVGSFVWSHLHNLLKSASPVNVFIQGLLADADLGNKFNMDRRRFSRNYEYSLFFDDYNFGFTSDSNLIFGTDSYIPKSLSLNLTADVFGESINFFELNTRLEGYEHLLESVFGPNGPLNGDVIRDKFKRLYDKLMNSTSDDSSEEEIYDRKRRDLRSGRAMKPELESSIGQFGYTLKNNPRALRTVLGLKIFGNDLRYRTSEGPLEFNDLLQYVSLINYASIIFSGQELTYTKSGVFLDAFYQVPLITGVPLKVSALGASSLDTRFLGNFVNSTNEGYNVEVKFKPSVSVDVISNMNADLFYETIGVKVKANLYSSTAVEANIKLKTNPGDQLVSVQLNLPQERNEILSVRSEMTVLQEHNEIRQRGFKKRYTNSTCTWPYVEKAVGLKLCADYSLPDVSKTKLTHPSLILSGPVKLDIHLDKADPTARLFELEYRWVMDNLTNIAEGSMIFHTPGSEIPRVFSANLTTTPSLYSASMDFRNGDLHHSAIGEYSFSEVKRHLNISLNLNGQEYLALEVGMNRTTWKNGYIYQPKFLLEINRDKIAGMVGKLKVTNKNNVMQCDVEIVFETKRLRTKLGGYVMRNEVSLNVGLDLNYQFIDSKEEQIYLNMELSNRQASRSRDTYKAYIKLQSTAYPKLNFALNNQIQQSLGHIEAIIDFNDATDFTDPRHSLITKITVARFAKGTESSTTNAAIEITRPVTHTDFLLRIMHEEKIKHGKTHTILGILRYATNKEITSIFSLYFPLYSNYGFDFDANVTVPNMEPCVLNFSLTEISRKTYGIFLNGTWFSGHTMTTKGRFQDRSSSVKRYHHLKLLAQSPSFEDTFVDVKYSLDEYEMKFDAQADYKKQPYALVLKHSDRSATETVSYAEFKWREKHYWISTELLSSQPKQLTVEMHLDKFRDVALVLKGIATDTKSEAGIEVKWDANRDPTQRLVVSLEFNTPAYRNYEGKLLVSYPDRAFSGIFDLTAAGPEYTGSLRLAWSLTEAIEVKFDSGAILEPHKDVWLIVDLSTPFDGWKKNALNAGVYHDGNLLRLNTSFLWAETQKLGFEFLGDYEIDESLFSCELKTAIVSTVRDIPPMSAHIKHRHNDSLIETEGSAMYVNINGTQIYQCRSSWELARVQVVRHIIGAITFKSPFEKFTRGTMVTKISLFESKEMKAAADLELEDRQYTMVAEGYLRKITDCALITNITTPNEKFRTIEGRFGISERDRHVVAEVRAPIGALGAEVLFNFMSSSNFDVKVSLATPAEAFTRLMLVAKMNPTTVDLRGALNQIYVGFTGMWRKRSMTDFEYSYKVYTPIELLEYTGIVLKFVKLSNTEIDLDMSLKLASFKLGLTTLLKPKPPLIKQLGKQKSNQIHKYLSDDDFLKDMNIAMLGDESSEEEEESDEDEEELLQRLSFTGNFKLDTIVWPTIHGDLDMEEIDYNYYLYSTINLPQGRVEIRDRFYLFSLLTMKNRVKILTPFVYAKEVQSEFLLSADLGKSYTAGFDATVKGQEDQIDLGVLVNLTKSNTKNEMMRNLNVRVVTPLKGLPYVNFNGVVEREFKNYRGNISVETMTTIFSLGGNLEVDDNFFDSTLLLTLQAPLVPHYSHRIFLHRAIAGNETHFKLGFANDDNGIVSELSIDGDWKVVDDAEFYTRAKLYSTILPIRSIQGTINLNRVPTFAIIEILYIDVESNPEEIKLRVAKESEQVQVDLSLPIEGFREIAVSGVLENTDNPELLRFVGNVNYNDELYTVDGTATISQNNIPKAFDFEFRPATGGSSGKIKYSYKPHGTSEANQILLRLEKDQSFTEITNELKLVDQYNWGYKLLAYSSEEYLDNVIIDIQCELQEPDRIISNFEMKSPWEKSGLGKLRFGSEANINAANGWLRTIYELNEGSGTASLTWSWELIKNMKFLYEAATEYKGGAKKSLLMGVSFSDPTNSFDNIVTTGNIHVNDLWVLDANATLNYPQKGELATTATIKLPLPVGDTHKLAGSIFLNRTKDEKWVEVKGEGSYEAVEAQKRYAGKGRYKNDQDLHGFGRIEWGPDTKANASQINLQLVQEDYKQAFTAACRTPYFLDEETFKTNIVYGKVDVYHVVSSSFFIPASVKVTEADVAFASISSMKGMINSTTPFLNVTWLRVDFDFNTTEGESIRYLKGSWPNNSAVLDAKAVYQSNGYLEHDLQGTVKIDVPLQTRHAATIIYGLKQKQATTHGHTTIEYNEKNVLIGQYTSKLEARGETEKRAAQITLKNEFFPIGVNYDHIVNASYDLKRAEVFELNKTPKFNITGELHIRALEFGNEYKIVAIHPNRTVILTADYTHQDDETQQKSKIELAPDHWLGYDIHLRNETTDTSDMRWFYFEIMYPQRNISANGSYALTEESFDSDVQFKWAQKDAVQTFETEYEYDDVSSTDDESSNDDADVNQKYINVGLAWKNEPLDVGDKDKQSLLFSLKHPSFEKDVTLKGTFYRGNIDLLRLGLVLDYSDDEAHLANFSAVVRDISTIVGYRNYTIEVLGHHEASEFDLIGFGSLGSHSGHYEISSYGSYKRGYLGLQEGAMLAYLDLRKKDVKYFNSSPSNTSGIWVKIDMNHPVYSFNTTFVESPLYDGVGNFTLDLWEKYVLLNMNMTQDGSQKLKMYGAIPDNRQAFFDLYRDYEDIRVTDIAYYIKMNHSRLITSHFKWRPTLKAEVKDKIKDMITNYYNSLSVGLDDWVKILYKQTKETVSDIYRETEPKIEGFLSDMKELSLLEDDINGFISFANASYQADDFYIRSVMNFTLTVLDELALKNHIASVPMIFKEMWQVLGESGQTLRKSILWLLDTLQKSYKNALDMISGILHGDALTHLSTLIESGVKRYDQYAKDLHKSFIKYVEKLYTTLTSTIQSYWERMLQSLQPSIMKALNYIEHMTWNISKEVLDFLYQRTDEIVNSPYFNQFHNITADLDRLYKDLVSNDAITNIKKYSVLVYKFLKEKYFKLVPFGKELNELITELQEEVKGLEKLEFIQIIMKRFEELQAKAEWLAEEFQIEKRMHQLWLIMRNKLMLYGQTALEAESKHREAKTKFIFDPDIGIMDLEQKLPMSWHAFNETPQFNEVPEYQLVLKVQNYFAASNFSLWNFVYEIHQAMDISTWLPPYSSHAVLVGSRHFITFDGNFVSLGLNYHLIDETRKEQECSYLLSRDFLDRNFTLLLEPSILKNKDNLIATRKLSMIVENKLVDIDISADVIRFGRNLTSALPVSIGDTVIYRDTDILSMESANGFTLKCNLQFDICSFDLVGWYHGKTAGILGTMNSEMFDDATLSDGRSAKDETEFINSWALPNCQKTIEPAVKVDFVEDKELYNSCELFFKSKVSYFASCYPLVDSTPFYQMCLDLGLHSISNLIEDPHPSIKGACTAALAYIEVCERMGAPLRVPDACVHCSTHDGGFVPEGNFINITDSNIKNTSDVVFLVEAKDCNKDIVRKKSITTLVTTIEKELQNANITNNRYSVVAFGGSRPFDKARSIVVNNQVFTTALRVLPFFNHIKTSQNGTNNDIFEAIVMASKMLFRSGASKTFILLPCSTCGPLDMALDYSSILQVLLENGITLHVITDYPFVFEKVNDQKGFFGLDRSLAFTKNDVKDLKGDVSLLKYVSYSKKHLGLCAPLALETNGTIFSSEKLKPEKKNPVKKFCTIFGKALARTAIPNPCQICECTGHNTGVAYMICTPCRYPSPSLWGMEDFDDPFNNPMVSGAEYEDAEDDGLASDDA